MKSVQRLFGEQQHADIEAAIRKAEERTAGEILPVVARVSGRYDRAEDIFGFLCAMAVFAATWSLADVGGGWGDGDSFAITLPVLLGLLLLGFVAGAALATRVPILRLPFISRAEMLAEVEQRAQAVFQQQRIRNTQAGTGLLIYVSLYEHLVKVIADDGAADKIPAEVLGEICDRVVVGIKQGDLAAGLQDAIERAGEVLAEVLPRATDDVDELPNNLILLD